MYDINDYILGLLYGDGSFQMKEKYELFFFSTTHKELADKVEDSLNINNIHHSRFQRVYGKGHEKENYEILEIIEIYNKDFHKFLIENGFKSDKASERVKTNPHFIRGYLETKGTLFQSYSRDSEFWRVAFSGNYDDVQYIKESLEERLNIEFHNVTRRKERESLGIVSKSFRLSIQNRIGIAKLIEYINVGDVSEYLKQRIEGFTQFNTSTPHNMKKKVFKHYKYAVGFMARELGLTMKGVKNAVGAKGFKPVYLWEDDTPILGFKGWTMAYKWICLEYKEKTGFNPPPVESEN